MRGVTNLFFKGGEGRLSPFGRLTFQEKKKKNEKHQILKLYTV